MACRMTWIPMTDPKWGWRSLLLFNTQYSGYINVLTMMFYTAVWKHMWLAIMSLMLKVKDFPRSHTKVVICQKQCKIETLLSQTTNTKWYTTYFMAAITINLSVLEVHSPYCKFSQMGFFVYLWRVHRAVPLHLQIFLSNFFAACTE